MKRMMTILSLILNVILIFFILNFAWKKGYIGRLLVLGNANYLELPTDTLSAQDWWQREVQYQAYVASNRQFKVCIFGDSISASLGNTLGNNTFNFAIDGMSTISQLEQLKFLTAVNVRCQIAILALGTNDAAYRTMDAHFQRNMQQIIRMIKEKMQAQQVVLIPAFYSTVAASQDLTQAGTIERVDRINEVIRQIAEIEKLMIFRDEIQPLFTGKALKENLTLDGVHLNLEGKKIYREALLKIVNSHPKIKT